jgi:hypothetical protein
MEIWKYIGVNDNERHPQRAQIMNDNNLVIFVEIFVDLIMKYRLCYYL